MLDVSYRADKTKIAFGCFKVDGVKLVLSNDRYGLCGIINNTSSGGENYINVCGGLGIRNRSSRIDYELGIYERR